MEQLAPGSNTAGHALFCITLARKLGSVDEALTFRAANLELLVMEIKPSLHPLF